MLRLSPRRALSRCPQWTAHTHSGVQSRWASNGNNDAKHRSERVKATLRKSVDSDPARSIPGGATNDSSDKKPSLIEQLFPEEAKRNEEAQRAAARATRDIPRLPLDELQPIPGRGGIKKIDPTAGYDVNLSPVARRKLAEMKRLDRENREVTVLVMRNASLNLTDDDFRRLIPQGRHMEGWTLERDDIIKVVPGRNMAILEQENYYYLLFSSQLAAYTYQGHVTRMFRTVATQTPSSVTSPMPPPPGYMIDGMDAHAVIETFSLLPPSQRLELRQLSFPLAPAMASIVRHQGYAALVNRSDKSPFECRLTFDGPQLHAPLIRYIILKTGQSIGVTWSGGDALVPKITKWDPTAHLASYQPSPLDTGSKRALEWQRKQAEAEKYDAEATAELTRRKEMDRDAQLGGFGRPRAHNKVVYILGFHTAGAAQRFMAFWHRREMVAQDHAKGRKAQDEHDDEDAPAVANVEMLW